MSDQERTSENSKVELNPSQLKSLVSKLAQLEQQLRKVVLGQPRTIHWVMVNLLCGGHLLLEDVPGLGKTTLAKALARSLSLSFKRLQCTPDLLPSDITGINIFDQKTQAFKFVPGPVFTHILLADEINRTSPRTQSALLEAMAEKTVTVDRQTRKLPVVFMVIATQNPVEFSGTYPLPEAQLDRFFMRLSMGYPKVQDEASILALHQGSDSTLNVSPLLTEKDLLACRAAVDAIHVDEKIMHYIAELAKATREHDQIRLGVSPRGSLALMRACQAHALLKSESIVTAQMVQELLLPVWGHRILLRGTHLKVDAVLEDVAKKVQVPAMPLAGDDDGLSLEAEPRSPSDGTKLTETKQNKTSPSKGEMDLTTEDPLIDDDFK